ncbi:transposase [Mesorhizobium sp.]|uniref:transposase n=1 Tax=Mesorhizobium sp. TaxID=1871066 RepID=UPI0025FB899F|nr:transposase [Mesorhizobium sp.]
MPVSGDTLLRMIRAAGFEPPDAPRVVGIDDWACRKGQRYGTIICDLERNRVLDLLPDRNANTVASWMKRHPGIEVIARDRAGLYADGARRGAPDATQVADRWHLLQNLGEALRLALGRHRKAVSAAGKAMMAEMAMTTPIWNHQWRLPRSLMACAGRAATSAVNSMLKSLICGRPACRRDRSHPGSA